MDLKKDLPKILEGVIYRLEEARNNALLIGDEDTFDLEAGDLDPDASGYGEGSEAALTILEGRLEHLAQDVGEEIENLRGLLENLEEDLD
jgi:hypothetical protein